MCEYIKTQEICPLDQVHVVYISNENKTVGKTFEEKAEIDALCNALGLWFLSCVMQIPIWKQKSSKGNEPVIWVRRSL